MFHVKVLGLGVVSVAAAVMVVGYSRQGNAVLSAMEEMNKTFIKEKSDWEETKDKLIDRLFSQEETIKDLEGERKNRDVNILKMEKRLEGMEARLEEMDAEEKRNCLLTAAIKEEMGEERNKWEEVTIQLIREKEALSQKYLSAEQNIERMKRTAEDKFIYAVQKMEVMRSELKTENGAFCSRDLLYSSLQSATEQKIEGMDENEMMTKAFGALKMDEN